MYTNTNRRIELRDYLILLTSVLIVATFAFIGRQYRPEHAFAEELTFGEVLQIDPDSVVFPSASYWIWPGAPEYKNDVLRRYQDLLRARGIDDEGKLKLVTGQLIQENGALAPDRHGDSGCSVGIPQRYVCQYGYTAKSFLKKYSEWNDTEFQLGWMADHMKAALDKYGTARLAIISHNRPASANAGVDTKAGYFKSVSQKADLLTLE